MVDALSGYMDFAEYGSSLIWPEQIPKEDWKKVFIVDARDTAQFAREHIPGAVINGKFMNLNFPSITRRGLIVIDPKPGAVFHLSRRSQCNGFF